MIEPADSKSTSGGVFDAGQLGHPKVHVAVDGGELAVRISITQVRPPAPQHGGEVSDNTLQLTA